MAIEVNGLCMQRMWDLWWTNWKNPSPKVPNLSRSRFHIKAGEAFVKMANVLVKFWVFWKLLILSINLCHECFEAFFANSAACSHYFRCISHPSNSCEASVWTNMAQSWRCLCDNVWKLCRAMSCNGMRYFRYKSCTSFDGKMDMPRHNESRWSMLVKVDERFGQRKEKTFVIYWNETLIRWQRKSVLEWFGAIRCVGLPAL